ncbi:MAG: sugar ABC transporter permease [Thermotogae bacterium]|nr:sugar ABC transporter permease [Thermotogota bacterium]RKX43502.1 MAG: sugar ABC transporter permease [Thermotogota bacterium]
MGNYHKKLKLKQTLLAYLFLLVPLVVMIVFIYYPIGFGVALSTLKTNLLGEGKFVGLENFKKLFSDKYFWNAFFNSLIYLLVVPPLQLASIILAVLVNAQIRGKHFLRLLMFLPVVTPVSIVALTWRWIFREHGVLNYLLLGTGLVGEPVGFLSDPNIALFSIMFVTMWKGLGYYMMIYLAGLQGIPQDYIDAARIDGAKRWQVFFKVTIPLLKPYIFFCSVMSSIAALNVFGEIYAMTRGGPNHATETIPMFVYNNAFRYFKFGYSSAAATIFSLVVFAFTLLNFRIFKEGGVQSYNG